MVLRVGQVCRIRRVSYFGPAGRDVMPTFPQTVTMAPSLTGGGGGDASQWGPCPPGSLMEQQELGFDVRSASAALVSTDECGSGPHACTGCGCGCAGGPDAQAGPYQKWLPTGPARINPANGNLVLALGVPAGGPLQPDTCSYYNAQSTDADNFGYGWGHTLRRWVEEPTSATADLHQGGGTVLHYTDRSPMTGLYTPPAGATSKLQKARTMPAKWMETRPDGFVYEYNSSGDVVKLQNTAGAIWTLSYTGTPPRLESVLDPGGGRLTYTYDAGYQIETITDPGGRATQWEVDGSNNLVRHVTPELCTTSLTYDASHRLTGLTDPAGHCHSYTYDAASRVTSYTDPLGQRTSFSYQSGPVTAITNALAQVVTLQFNSDGNLTQATDPLGQLYTYTWDAKRLTRVQNPLGESTTLTYYATSEAGQRLTGVQNPLGQRVTFTYDASDRPQASIDPLGARLTAVYNAGGQKTAVVDPLGYRTSFTYNGSQQVTALTNPLGEITTQVYDSAGSRAAEVNPLGQRTSYTYSAAGQVTAVENPLGQRTTLTLDDMNRVLAVEDPLGQRTSYTYDLTGQRTSTEDAMGQRRTQVYDSAGRLSATIDPLGQRTSWTYDAAGHETAETNPLGSVTTSVYDAVGQRLARENPLGYRTTNVYDAAGRAIGTLDPLGQRNTLVYDRAGRTVAQVNPLGQRVTSVFDTAGRVVASVDPLGYRTTNVYDAASQRLARENPLGSRTTNMYDAAGRAIGTIDPLGQRNTLVYDRAGRTVAQVNPLGYRTTSVYDAAGQPVARENALGQRVTSVYDAAGQVVAQVDPLGSRTSFTYDAARRPIVRTNALGSVSSTVYDAAGQPVATINPLGASATSVYDAAGRVLAQVNALGYRTTSVYDAAGRPQAVLDPLGYATTLTYDAAGRRIATTNALGLVSTIVYDAMGSTSASIDPLGRRTSFTYDAAGRQVALTKPRGNITTQVYDVAGRAIATVDGLGGRVTFTLDAADRLVALTDSENQITTYQYDSAGQKIQELYPDHVVGTNPGDANYGIVSLTYDAAGRLQRKTDQLGDTCAHAYDLNGRLSHRDYRTRANSPSGAISDITTFTYDAVGQLLSATSGRYGNGVAQTYDATGRRRTEALTAGGQTYTVTHTYDAASQLAHQTYPDGSTVDRAYTARGQLAEVQYNGHAIATRVYDALGRLIQSTAGNGVITTHTYQADDPHQGIEVRDATGGLIDLFTFTYDANRNKMSEARGGVMANWGFSTGASGYDNKDRLVAWNRTDGNQNQSWTLTYEGDWHDFADAGTAQHRTHGAAHELTVIDSTSLTYDAKGNLTRNVTGDTYTWDFDNQLRTATVSGSVTTLAYDALGRRVSKASGATTNVYVSATQPLAMSSLAGQILAQYPSGAAPSSPTEKFVYGVYIDEPLIKVGTGGTLYYHANDLFSVSALSDTGGAVLERYRYTAYGVLTIRAPDGVTVRSASSYANSSTFTGREWDSDLQLFYYRARFYAAQLGRFVSRDPVGYASGLSVYVAAFVPNKLDPSGLQGLRLPVPRIRPPSEWPELQPGYRLDFTDPYQGMDWMKLVKSNCRNFLTRLLSNTDYQTRLFPEFGELVRCNVNIYCGNCHGPWAAAFVPRFATHAHICLDSRKLDGQPISVIQAVFIHEAHHILQMLSAKECPCPDKPYSGKTPKIPGLGWNNCIKCKEREGAAYRRQAEHLYPPDQEDSKDFYDAFVAWGTCFSCDAVCPGEWPDGCPPKPRVPFPL
jgi:RHS repeat-associated protein